MADYAVDYEFWNARLRGDNSVDPVNMGGSDSWVSAGFFHNGTFQPIAIWRDPDDGIWCAKVGNYNTENPPEIQKIFANIMNKGACVTKEAYDARLAGTPFPAEAEAAAKKATMKAAADRAEAQAKVKQNEADAQKANLATVAGGANDRAMERIQAIGAVGVGHNAPPLNEITIREHVKALTLELQQIEQNGPVDSKEVFELVSLIKLRIASYGTDAETTHKAEKAPHLKAGREVDAKWNPIFNEVEVGKAKCATLVQPWIDAENARKAKEKREAQETARQAAAAGKPAPATPAAPRVKTGGQMRSYTFKATEFEEPLGLCKFAEFLATRPEVHPDFLEVCTKLAHRILTNGGEAPGAKLIDKTGYR